MSYPLQITNADRARLHEQWRRDQKKEMERLWLPEGQQDADGEVARARRRMAGLDEQSQEPRERQGRLLARRRELEARVAAGRFDDDDSLVAAIAAQRGLELLEEPLRRAAREVHGYNDSYGEAARALQAAWDRYTRLRAEVLDRAAPPSPARFETLVAEIRQLVGSGPDQGEEKRP